MLVSTKYGVINPQWNRNLHLFANKKNQGKNIKYNEVQISGESTKFQILDQGDFEINHMDLLTGYVDISDHLGETSPDCRVFSSIRN